MPRSFVAKGGLWVIAQMALLLAAIAVPWWQGSPGLGASPAQLGGLALILAGSLLFLTGIYTLGGALTPYPYPREHSRLRTGGAYALVRHPLYGGLLLATLGWTVLAQSVYGLAIWALLFLFFDRKAAREERWLGELHPGYPAYRARTKKLLPWIY